jgi:tripartite-type tricarboxylate transporter receptor subunit TctC
MRRRTIPVLALLGLATVSVHAQDKYPSHPIRVMVPFGAGSATDITIRIVGEQFRQIAGQGFVVENKPGVFGILAIEEMVKSPADGYTLEVGNAGTNVLSPIIYKSKFKFDYDNDHYDTEAFAQWAGIKLYHVPNKGGGGAITNDVVRGDVQIVFVNAASSAGLAKAGLIRVLAVMADERLPDYPDAPTLKELGYTAGEGLWSALYAPARTPRDVLETLHGATVRALKSDAVKTTFEKQMIKAVPDATIAEAQAWSKRESAHWRELTERVKIDHPQ